MKVGVFDEHVEILRDDPRVRRCLGGLRVDDRAQRAAITSQRPMPAHLKVVEQDSQLCAPAMYRRAPRVGEQGFDGLLETVDLDQGRLGVLGIVGRQLLRLEL